MSFELHKKEPVPEGIRRIVAERIQNSLKSLQRKTGSRDEAVHAVRKQLKEVRAALRLVRYEVGENLFRKKNTTFRNATQPLSEIRDADVMMKTLDQLLVSSSDKAALFKPLREAFCERRRRIRRQALGPKHATRRISAILKKELGCVERWPIRHKGWKAVKPGLKKTYKRSWQAMIRALKDGSDEAMHEWRKRVKYQRHHLEILRKSGKEFMNPLVHKAQALSDVLGQHHDLTVLKELAKGEMSDSLKRNEREMLLALVAERQQKLQKKAAKVGRLLYAKKGREFTSRIHEYWRAWR